ncbi:hypothetical protein IPJ72_04785 [Candidatus Peregrinibacteria bacterium]|nr:MAG: hypothetical protein IPJ72_04785 [Candidatus Peregrinibacteria bacterium]
MLARRFEVNINPPIESSELRSKVHKILSGMAGVTLNRESEQQAVDAGGGETRQVTTYKGTVTKPEEAAFVLAFPETRAQITEILGHKGVQLNFEISTC